MSDSDTLHSKLEMLEDATIDESSEESQRLTWEALEKSINHLVNKANGNNLPTIVHELVKENLIRGAGVLCQSLLTAQSNDPSLTNVYAALAAIVNSKLPQIGKILISRLIEKLRKNYVQNDKEACVITATFIAHLFNQDIAIGLLALELLTFLIENPTSDCVEIAVTFLKECGAKLKQTSPKGFSIIFDMLRKVKGELDTRAQSAIEAVMSIRKDAYKDHPSIILELDLLKEKDKITHQIELGDELEIHDELNEFQFDPNYLENEIRYNLKRKFLLDSIGSISLHRKLYLNLQSSLKPEEAAHRLIKLQLKDKDRTEMCFIIVDCCAQQTIYTESHGLIVANLCSLSPEYVSTFSSVFVDCYTKIDRFHDHPNKLRNVAKFTVHLLITDSIPWTVFSCIQLDEKDTIPTGQAFIKDIFQELVHFMGISKLESLIKDTTLKQAFAGIFPHNSPKDREFTSNFFTQIGLDPLAENLKVMDRSTVDSNEAVEIEESPCTSGQREIKT